MSSFDLVPEFGDDNEYGIVRAVGDDGVAQVEMKRTGACSSCGLCICSADKSTMILKAFTHKNVRPGDRVRIEIDRGMRSRAQLWLLALPLATFLSAALIARLALHLSDALSLLCSLAAMAGAFFIAWRVDVKAQWSTRPVARIIPEI